MKTTNKILSLILSALMMLSLFSLSACDTRNGDGNEMTENAGESTTDGNVCIELDPNASKGLEYTLNDDGESYSVAGIGTCTDTEVIISSKCNNLPVTSVEAWVFSGCTSLTSITIPNSITSIGNGAFYGCDNLSSITIPDGVTSIEDDAFSSCTSLANVIIGNSVTSIGENVFSSCTSLANVIIGNSVTSIGENVFYGCWSLTSITVNENNSNYKSIDGNLYGKDGTELIWYALGKANTSFVIPNSVTSIGDSAFLRCESLTNITIPDSVTSIGDHAFSGCTSLTSVTIPDSVTSIGRGVFSKCESLTNVTFRGTKAEWEAIEKHSDWRGNVPSFTVVHCSDGDVEVS